MLTQHAIRTRLDTIAAEVLKMPGIYYELYSRLFSQRVHEWMRSVSRPEAIMIEAVAELDPDFCPHYERVEIEYSENTAHLHAQSQWLFNPAWDVQYQ